MKSSRSIWLKSRDNTQSIRSLLLRVIEVHQNEPEYFDNVGEDRRASVIMIGMTNSGRTVSVPIEPTNKKETWRPVTAFESNSHHRRRYLERRGE